MAVPSLVSSYDLGELVTVQASFYNSAGALTDPTTVAAKIKDPAGTETSYTYGGAGTITRVSAGVYQQTFTPSVAGVHTYRFSSTGLPQTAEEFTFYVEASNA